MKPGKPIFLINSKCPELKMSESGKLRRAPKLYCYPLWPFLGSQLSSFLLFTFLVWITTSSFEFWLVLVELFFFLFVLRNSSNILVLQSCCFIFQEVIEYKAAYWCKVRKQVFTCKLCYFLVCASYLFLNLFPVLSVWRIGSKGPHCNPSDAPISTHASSSDTWDPVLWGLGVEDVSLLRFLGTSTSQAVASSQISWSQHFGTKFLSSDKPKFFPVPSERGECAEKSGLPAILWKTCLQGWPLAGIWRPVFQISFHHSQNF